MILLRLRAAFDTEEECVGLLTAEFPDLVEEDLLNAVAQLGQWKESMERPFKRKRVELARQVLFRLPFPGQTSVHGEFTRLTRTSAICILEVCTPVGMNTLFPIFENSCFETRVSCEYISLFGACQPSVLLNKQAVVFLRSVFSTQQNFNFRV